MKCNFHFNVFGCKKPAVQASSRAIPSTMRDRSGGSARVALQNILREVCEGLKARHVTARVEASRRAKARETAIKRNKACKAATYSQSQSNLVPPLQGGGSFLRGYPGLRASRCTPGYHIAGLQPCQATSEVGAGSACPPINHQPSTINHRSGIALVITLVLLSVITFMAVTFLVVSRHEGAQVDTITQQSNAKFAADAAAQQAMAQVIAQMQTPIGAAPNTYTVGLNPFARNGLNGSPYAPEYSGLLVSTNWIQAFYTGTKNITDVSYYADINQNPLTGAAYLAMLNNLLILPRAPVFVTTNRALPYSDFRYWLDLNRNGVYDTNGLVAEADASGKPVTNFYVGDPEWIGVLNHPEQRHSPSNFFVARYAFIALPIGNSLDVNYIHNQAKLMGDLWADGYMRNEGVGSWELNLAGFLRGLHTGWDDVDGPTRPGYKYSTNNNMDLPGSPSASSGASFDDATAILQYRLANNYNTLRPFYSLYGNTALALFANDFIDGSCYGPLMTGTALPSTDGDRLAALKGKLPWCGDFSTNRFFSPQDFFKVPYNPASNTNSVTTFANHLYRIGRTVGPPVSGGYFSATNSYNRHTFYRMLSQMSFGSQTPEYPNQNAAIPALANNLNYMSAYSNAPRMNLNYVDVNGTNASSFIPWTPVQFFTNAADRMLRAYFPNLITNVVNGVTNTFYLSIGNIPVYPNNFYTPAVHRILQLAANMYDASTNKTGAAPNDFDYPSVFQPYFLMSVSGSQTNFSIAGYVEVSNALPAISAPLDLRRAQDIANFPAGKPTVANVYGIPYVIGARRGFPTFNRFTYAPIVSISRKIQIIKPSLDASPGSGGWFTNIQYAIGISNAFAVDCWYGYTNNFYGRSIGIYVTNDLTVSFTNNLNVPLPVTNTVMGTYNLSTPTSGTWWGTTTLASGGIGQITSNSFKVPLNTNFIAYGDKVLRLNPYSFVDATNFINSNIPFDKYNGGNGYLVPQWGVNITNRVRLMMVDNATGRLIDYVQLSGGQLDQQWNINSDLQNLKPDSPMWQTNLVASANIPQGINNQIQVSEGSTDPATGGLALWRSIYSSKQNGIQGFLRFLGKNANTLQMEVPMVANTKYYRSYNLSVNDPLVHYTVGDLTWLTDPHNSNPFQPDAQSVTIPSTNVNFLPTLRTVVKERMQSWGNTSTDAKVNRIPGNEMAYKDSLVTCEDLFQFPTNKYPNVGWLGRVHRGTPWQSVYLKSSPVDNGQWPYWTGDVATNYFGINDPGLTQPANDWLLMDLFTTAPNDNAEKGQLSINQTGTAAWSAVLDGVITITNDTKGNAGPWPISPTDTNAITGSNIVENLVYSINTNRAAVAGGVFTSLGQICSVPQLTINSPYLAAPTAASDAVVERIPQQIMSLLKVGTPRYVIFAYGQSLKPADHSIVTSGPFFGMCTNYQITGETVTRTVVRFDNYPVPGQPASPHPRAVIESFNVLPPE